LRWFSHGAVDTFPLAGQVGSDGRTLAARMYELNESDPG
jgi:hypothetical protein